MAVAVAESEEVAAAAARLAAAMRETMESHTIEEGDEEGGEGGGVHLRVPLLSNRRFYDGTITTQATAAATAAEVDNGYAGENAVEDHPLQWPQSVGPGLLHAVLFPSNLALYLTIPSRAAMPRWCEGRFFQLLSPRTVSPPHTRAVSRPRVEQANHNSTSNQPSRP